MKPNVIVPDSRIGRARGLMLAFGVLLMLLPIGQFDQHSSLLLLSVVALAAIVGIQLATARRRKHVTILEAPATAVLAVLAGVSFDDPRACTVIGIGVILTQTLYDRPINSLLRAVCFLPVMPLAALFSQVPGDMQLTWHSAELMPPTVALPLLLGLLRLLKGALDMQQQAFARVRFLVETTGELLTALNPQMVGHMMATNTDRLCELLTGSTAVAVYRGDRRVPARVYQTHGATGSGTPEDIPAEVLAPLDPLVPHQITEVPFSSRTLGALGLPKGLAWYAIDMGLPPEVAAMNGVDTMLWGIPMDFSERFVGVRGPGGAEAVELIQTVTSYAQVAFDAAVERMQLLERAGTDSSSGLPSRDVMVRRMMSVMDVEGMSCGLVVVRFDGHREIIVEHGLAGWSQVVRQIGKRVVEVQESLDPDAFTARLGDDLMGIALPGSPELIPEALDLLRRRLAQPVLLDGAVIYLAINLGSAGHGDGSTATDLLGTAIARMFRAPVEVGLESDLLSDL